MALSSAVTWVEMLARSDSTCATSRLGRLRANPEAARAARTTAEEKMRTIFLGGGLSWVGGLVGWAGWDG